MVNAAALAIHTNKYICLYENNSTAKLFVAGNMKRLQKVFMGHVTPTGTTNNWTEVISNEPLACEHKTRDSLKWSCFNLSSKIKLKKIV